MLKFHLNQNKNITTKTSSVFYSIEESTKDSLSNKSVKPFDGAEIKFGSNPVPDTFENTSLIFDVRNINRKFFQNIH